jgi:hypothetical protein
MTYYVVRLYTGSGEQPAEELLKGVVAKELAPQLREAGGLIRYITGIADDGRIVSASTYQDKEDAQRGVQVARELVARTNVLRGYQLTQTLEGEVAALLNGDVEYEPAFGMARLFSTNATAEKVVETIRKARASAQDKGASQVRTVIVQLQDGRVGSFAAYDSKETRDRHSAAIKEHQASAEMKNILPSAPEEIPVRIITSMAGQ